MKKPLIRICAPEGKKMILPGDFNRFERIFPANICSLRRTAVGRLVSRTLVILVLFFAVPTSVFANSKIYISENEAVPDFPNGVIFFLAAESDEEIQNVVLSYGTDVRTCQENTVSTRVEVIPSTQINVDWEWDWKRTGILPPGAQVWWQWEVQDKSGTVLTSPVERIEIQDQRHEWNYIKQDGVHVQWYQGDEAFGNNLLQIASDSLENLNGNLGISPSEAIRLIVYPNVQELQETLLVTTEWTAGVAMVEYSGIMAAIGEDELDWAEMVIPHEMSHLVVDSMVFNCRGVYIPSWLDEGLAEINENPPTEEEILLISAALEKDTLPDLCTLERGFSAYSGDAHLSYVQSKLVVNYLIDEFGTDNLLQLLHTLQTGERINPALQKVYGFDTDQLDDAWRAAVGFPREPGRRVNTIKNENKNPVNPTPIPTLALMQPVSHSAPRVTPTPGIVSKEPVITATIPVITHIRTPTPTPRVQTSNLAQPPKNDSPDLTKISLFIAGGVFLLASVFVIHRKWGG